MQEASAVKIIVAAPQILPVSLVRARLAFTVCTFYAKRKPQRARLPGAYGGPPRPEIWAPISQRRTHWGGGQSARHFGGREGAFFEAGQEPRAWKVEGGAAFLRTFGGMLGGGRIVGRHWRGGGTGSLSLPLWVRGGGGALFLHPGSMPRGGFDFA